jgi:hypothetical protein
LPTERFCPQNTDLSIIHLDTLKEISSEDRAFVAHHKMWLGNGQDSDRIILHEFGHIMGLKDNYIEGEFVCRKGYQDSVMCQPYNWESLQANDWVGVQRSYCLQTGGSHPSCFNHEKRELLSFLPSRHKIYDNSPHDPYFFCSNKNFSISFSAFQFDIVPNGDENYSAFNVQGLLSTDHRSLTESYSEQGFKFSFTLYDRSSKDSKDRKKQNTIVLELEEGTLKASFPYKEEWHHEIFTDCDFDDTTAEYLALRNIDVNEIFTSNKDYVRLLKNPKSSLTTLHSGSGNLIAKIRATVDLKPESISVYAGDNHILLTKKPFDELAKVTERTDDGIIIEVDMNLVPPSTEDLELFVEGHGTTLLHVKLKKDNPAPSI